MSAELAARYSHAPDYPEVAKTALAEMVRQVGGDQTTFDEDGIMKRGVIVRHLELPGCIEDSKAVIRYLYKTYGNNIYISIMNQYTPMEGIGKKFPELNRKLTEREYDELVDYAISIGVENVSSRKGKRHQKVLYLHLQMKGYNAAMSDISIVTDQMKNIWFKIKKERKMGV